MTNLLSASVIAACAAQLGDAERGRAAGDRAAERDAFGRVLSMAVAGCRVANDPSSAGRWRAPLRLFRTIARAAAPVELSDVTETMSIERLSFLDKAMVINAAARFALVNLTWSGDSGRWLPWLVLVDEHLPQVMRDAAATGAADVVDQMRILHHVVQKALAASFDNVGQGEFAEWPCTNSDTTLHQVTDGAEQAVFAEWPCTNSDTTLHQVTDGAEQAVADSYHALQYWLDAMDRATEAQASGDLDGATRLLDSLRSRGTALPHAIELVEAKRDELTRASTGDVMGARDAIGRQLRVLGRAIGGVPRTVAANFGIGALQHSMRAHRIDLALNDLAQILILSSADEGPAAMSWRALALFAEWADANGRMGMACLFLKLAIQQINEAGIRLPQLAVGEEPTPDDDVAGIYVYLTELLVSSGRISEATEVLERRLTGAFCATPLSLTTEEKSAIDRIALAIRLGRVHFDAPSVHALVQALDAAQVIAAANAPAAHTVTAPTPSEGVRAAAARSARATALLYYSVQPDSVTAIVHVDGQSMVVPIGVKGEAAINALVFDILRAVSDVRVDPLPLLQNGHEWLIAPVREHLDRAERVVVCAPGVLHGLPWAALHDGERFAVQRWSWVRSVPAATVDLERPPAEPPRLLSCAATGAAGNLPAIGAAASEELAAIAARFGGTSLVDDEFTRAQLLRTLPSATILHVVSHFVPRPGDLEHSHLLLGDGTTITVAQLLEIDVSGLDLIVLAACRSGIADGQLASPRAVAIDAALLMGGGRAAVGNLWSVDSAPTRALMTAFYDGLAAGLDKDCALTSAQVALLTGGEGRWRLPFFWAAPVLSGNWQGWPPSVSREC